MANEELQQKWSELVKRAWSDDQLKQRLLNDPEPLLRESGVEIPEGTKPRVVVDKDTVSVEFLPKTAQEGELTENALGAVVGGDNTATTLSNLANMRHEMLKAVANNLRS